VTLPLYAALTEENVTQVVRSVQSAVNQVNKK
jgi:dTDP-4-amino-4,6-dideoxygalactose transaminase